MRDSCRPERTTESVSEWVDEWVVRVPKSAAGRWLSELVAARSRRATEQQGEAVFKADWDIVRALAQLGMEERAKGGWCVLFALFRA